MYTSTPSPLIPGRPHGLRTQLLVALVIVSLLVALAATGALSSTLSVRDSAREAIMIDGRLSQLASEVATQTLESRGYEKDFFLNVADPHARSGYLAKWRTSVTAIEHAIAAFASTATAPEDQRQAEIWRAQLSQYGSHFQQVEGMVDQGEIATPAAANAAFAPFKETIRLLTESAEEVAERKATAADATSATLESTGTRATTFIALLAALALMMIVAYGAADMVPFRRYCVACDARLPFRHWFGGEHYCRRCELRRLEQQIADAERRQ